MPEALAIVAVFVIAIVIYFAMWLQTRDPALNKPHEELARMQHQVKWLEDRLTVARREQWGIEMVASIEAEHAATAALLTQAEAAQAEKKAGNVVAVGAQ